MLVPTPYARSVTPDAVSPQYDKTTAEAGAFGTQVAGAVAGLGNTLQDSAAVLTRIQQASTADALQRDDFTRETDLIKWRAAQEEKLVQRARDQSGTTALGFTSTMAKELDADIAQRLAQVPANERARWEKTYTAAKTQLYMKAYSTELSIRDATESTNLKSASDTLINGVVRDPNSLDTAIESNNKAIDATKLPNDQKLALKEGFKQAATYAALQKRAQEDPQAVLDAGGTDRDRYYARLRGAENASQDPNARPIRNGKVLSTARGFYQFLDGTWNQVVNSPEGRAAGLTENGRGNREQEEKAIRIFTEQNAAKLREAGYKDTPENLYLMHLLGAGGAMKLLRADPNSSAAAAVPDAVGGNYPLFYDRQREDGAPRTVQQFIANIARKFGSTAGSVDARVASLPQAQQQQIVALAQRQQVANATATETAAANQHNNWLNGLMIQLSNGQAGHADIDNAIKAGILTDYKEIHAATKQADAWQAQQAEIAHGQAVANGGGNVYRDEDKKALNTLYNSQRSGDFNKDAAIGLQMWRGAGFVPNDFTADLRKAIESGGENSMKAMQIAASMMASSNWNAFNGAANQKALEDTAIDFLWQTSTLGKNAKEAAMAINQQNSPEFKAKLKVNDDQLKQFKTDILKNGQNQIPKWFDTNGGWLPGGQGFWDKTSGSQRAEITATWAELAYNSFMENGGDKDKAYFAANKQMEKMFGVSNGRLMQYPPEKAPGYPELPDRSKAYIYQQAAKDASALAGIPLKPEQIQLRPIYGKTAESFNNGQKVPYEIYYETEVDGVRHVHSLQYGNTVRNAVWVADPEVAKMEWMAKKQAEHERSLREPGQVRAAVEGFGKQVINEAGNIVQPGIPLVSAAQAAEARQAERISRERREADARETASRTERETQETAIRNARRELAKQAVNNRRGMVE